MWTYLNTNDTHYTLPMKGCEEHHLDQEEEEGEDVGYQCHPKFFFYNLTLNEVVE